MKVNKPAASFILAGLAVIAASAIAVTWIGGNQNALSLGFYILGFAVLVAVLTFLVGNERMRAALGWILITAFALFMVGLVDAAAQITGRMPIPACYLKMLTEDPKTCMEGLSPRMAVTGTQNRPATAARPTVSPRLTQGTQVFLHYGPGIEPTDMVKLALELRGSGWPLRNPGDGGEFVKNSPSATQIRYYDTSSKRVAIRLAAEISSIISRRGIEVRDFSGSGLIAAPGLLEIWIAR